MADFGGTISGNISGLKAKRLFGFRHKAKALLAIRQQRKNNKRGSFQRKATQYIYRQRSNVKDVRNVEGIGKSKNVAIDKKDIILPGISSTFDTRSLYVSDMTDIRKATGAQEINCRLRQAINVTGFSVYVIMRNTRVQNMLVNFALISSKNSNAALPSAAGFFRDYEASRDVDFSGTLTANQLHTLPISTDKWHVLMHKRLNLAGIFANGGHDYTADGNVINLKWWVPLKRTLTFNDDSDQACESKVFLVWWCDLAWQGGTTPVGGALEGSVRSVTYFTELQDKPVKRFRIG